MERKDALNIAIELTRRGVAATDVSCGDGSHGVAVAHNSDDGRVRLYWRREDIPEAVWTPSRMYRQIRHIPREVMHERSTAEMMAALMRRYGVQAQVVVLASGMVAVGANGYLWTAEDVLWHIACWHSLERSAAAGAAV